MKRICPRVKVEIVKRSDQAKAFVVLPKRWICERTPAWLGRCRRLPKDWECPNRKALAFSISPQSDRRRVVTIDAMGCQRHIAGKIIDNKADYIVAIKAN